MILYSFFKICLVNWFGDYEVKVVGNWWIGIYGVWSWNEWSVFNELIDVDFSNGIWMI